MTRDDENYGIKLPYDPLWKGPMTVHRTATDFKFLKFFGVFFLFWVAITIYAFTKADVAHLQPEQVRYPRSINSFAGRDDPLNPDDIPAALRNASLTFLSCIVLSGALAVLYIYLLSWFARTIVWLMIGVVCLSLLIMTIAILAASPGGTNNDPQANTYVAMVPGITLLIIIIIVIVCRRKIDVACEVIREASKAVLSFPIIFAFPVPSFILFMMALSFFVANVVFLAAISQEIYHDNPNGFTGHITFFHFYNLFGYIWISNFIQGFFDMTMCGSYATWYWTINKNNIPDRAVLTSAGNTTKYHMGTVALGAMIITICQIIEYMLQKVKSAVRSTWCCCCFGLCLYNAYVYCFGNVERLLRYINTNALIWSSVHGTDFFDSARSALNLIMRNPAKAFITTKVTKVIINLGVVFAIIISSATSAWMVDHEDVRIRGTVAACVAICAGVISACVLKVLDTAVDTVFLCVLEDYERNDGSADKPYFMSFELKRMMLEDSAGI